MSNTADLNALLGDTAVDEGALSAMQLTADTLGPAIMAGLGTVGLDQIASSEVLLFTLLVDDSFSIETAGNSQAVRDGHNLVLDALQSAKQAGSVLISCRYLNDSPGTNLAVLYPYVSLEAAPRLDTRNYRPSGGTPLYDQTAVTLTGLAAKMAEFEDGGVSARAVTVIVTDGADVHSWRHTAGSIHKIVSGLLRTEQHIIAGMGIDDGGTDFTAVFRGMGIQDDWILTPGSDPSDIRRAFQVVSQSAVRASQAAGGTFSSVALGGFGS